MVHPETGRVHASFNQVVAATGRLSSSDPNLQNIPIRTEAGREIRSAFVPGDQGWVLLAADYSQIELRVLAHFSRDATLCEAFASDEDIHARVASQVNGVPLDEVTSDMRRERQSRQFRHDLRPKPFRAGQVAGHLQRGGRPVYFGVLCPVSGGRRLHATDARRLPPRWVRKNTARSPAVHCRHSAARQAQGTLFDDRPVPMQLNLPERTAVNTVIQGTAADLIKLAMLAVDRRIRDSALQSKMILQIHDELVFDCPAGEVDALRQLVVEEMSSVYELSVPLVVDIMTGENWAVCE